MKPINLLDFYKFIQYKLYLGIIHSKDYELGDLALLCKNLKSHTSHYYKPATFSQIQKAQIRRYF